MIQAGKISIYLVDIRIGLVSKLSKKVHNFREIPKIYEINYIVLCVNSMG